MHQITPNAQSHLLRLRRERGLDDQQAARFVENSGKVRLTFASEADPADREVAAREIRVLLAPEIAQRFPNSVIDARQQEGKEVLIIQPPKGRLAS